MPGYLLTMSAVVLCAHGGKANLTAPNPRVKIMGTPVPMSAPPLVIGGCAFPPPRGQAARVGPRGYRQTHTVRVKSMGMRGWSARPPGHRRADRHAGANCLRRPSARQGM
jgi:hypothetical protein